MKKKKHFVCVCVCVIVGGGFSERRKKATKAEKKNDKSLQTLFINDSPRACVSFFRSGGLEGDDDDSVARPTVVAR